jgi:hypothetical protein
MEPEYYRRARSFIRSYTAPLRQVPAQGPINRACMRFEHYTALTSPLKRNEQRSEKIDSHRVVAQEEHGADFPQ